MKQKINLSLAVIALVAILATTVSIEYVSYKNFGRRVQKDLKVVTELLKETEVFQDAYTGTDRSRAGADVRNLNHFSSEDLRITWIDDDGYVLFDTDAEADSMPNHLDRPEIQDALKTGEGESARESDTMGVNYFYYALRLEDGTVLRVSTKVDSMSSVFAAVLPMIGAISALILIGCIILGQILTASLIKPINAMAEHLDDSMYPAPYRELEPFVRKIRSQHVHILSAAKARQDFTASVSHELKTPLTAISGYTELIENHMVKGEDETRALQQIRHNADRLLSLINDIIHLSEMDHNEAPRPFEPFDLYSVAKDCCDQLQVNAKKKSVCLTFKGSAAGISGDRELIHELVINLVQNAITYNRPGGTVDVTVTIRESHPLLIVKDTGIGIPLEDQEHVFERFYRVDKSRSRENGGTGLGLAIVKHISEIHSAEVTMKSESGVGTEFVVKF